MPTSVRCYFRSLREAAHFLSYRPSRTTHDSAIQTPIWGKGVPLDRERDTGWYQETRFAEKRGLPIQDKRDPRYLFMRVEEVVNYLFHFFRLPTKLGANLACKASGLFI